jgi:hypothetical protein
MVLLTVGAAFVSITGWQWAVVLAKNSFILRSISEYHLMPEYIKPRAAARTVYGYGRTVYGQFAVMVELSLPPYG